MGKSYKGIICLALIIFLASVSMVAESAHEFGDKEGSRKILIVSDNSKFKINIVKQLFEYSSGSALYYLVVDAESAVKIDLNEYDNYICLCKMKGGKVDESTYAFYRTINDKDKILIGLTYLFKMPMPELAKQNTAGIDVITSASKKANIKKFSTDIINWINASNREQLQSGE